MTDTLIDETKARLRDDAKAQRAQLGAAERAEAAVTAAQHFFDATLFGDQQIVAAYWPIRDEIDCKPVLIKMMDDGQQVCLPVIVGDNQPLEFRIWEPGAALYESGFGTLAPAEGSKIVEPEVVIIPLLGFDRLGTRLGYGKGHYDRSIAAMAQKPKLIGYAFAAQEINAIPADAHDVPLDVLVTETGTREFG